MSGALRVGLRLCWLALALLVTPAAQAHEMSMAEMEVRETAPGDFIWMWTAVSDKRGVEDDLVPRWPDACSGNESALHCGSEGLKGTL
jgi:hypothetical protein